MSQGILKEYLLGVLKSTFFQRVSPGLWVKNDQILKSAFSLVYVHCV